jgi:hypothetical protein
VPCEGVGPLAREGSLQAGERPRAGRRGIIVLTLEILPSAVAYLGRLGWRDAAGHYHHDAITHAVREPGEECP